VAAKTLAKLVATAAPVTTRRIQGQLPKDKDLTGLTREGLNIVANTIMRQIS